jgi:hypothetical protein
MDSYCSSCILQQDTVAQENASNIRVLFVITMYGM